MLGGESHWKELARIRWKDAIHDPNQWRRAGRETVKTVATAGKGAAVVSFAVLLYAAVSAGGESNDSENSSGDDPEDSTDGDSEESWDDE